MRILKKLAPALLLAAAPLLSGCWTTHQLRMLEEHPTKPVLLLDTHSTDYFWFFGSWAYGQEHVFWTCTQGESEIRCRRACGGDTDLACPKAW